jgi:hypothetical protein
MWNLRPTQQTFWLSLVTCSELGPVRGRGLTGWCAAHSRTVLPASPETVAAFLAPDAGRGFAVNTLCLCHAALHYLYLLVGDQRSKALKIGNVKVSRRCTS